MSESEIVQPAPEVQETPEQKKERELAELKVKIEQATELKTICKKAYTEWEAELSTAFQASLTNLVATIDCVKIMADTLARNENNKFANTLVANVLCDKKHHLCFVAVRDPSTPLIFTVNSNRIYNSSHLTKQGFTQLGYQKNMQTIVDAVVSAIAAQKFQHTLDTKDSEKYILHNIYITNPAYLLAQLKAQLPKTPEVSAEVAKAPEVPAGFWGYFWPGSKDRQDRQEESK